MVLLSSGFVFHKMSLAIPSMLSLRLSASARFIFYDFLSVAEAMILNSAVDLSFFDLMVYKVGGMSPISYPSIAHPLREYISLLGYSTGEPERLRHISPGLLAMNNCRFWLKAGISIINTLWWD